MKGKIRIAKLKDAEEIFKLYEKEPNLKGENSAGYEIENIKDYIKNKKGRFFVYEFKDKILGVLYSEFHWGFVLLHTIVVKKEFRGQGISKKLMDALEIEMKIQGKNLIESFTETTNEPMKKVFEKEGYNKGKTFYYYYKEI